MFSLLRYISPDLGDRERDLSPREECFEWTQPFCTGNKYKLFWFYRLPLKAHSQQSSSSSAMRTVIPKQTNDEQKKPLSTNLENAKIEQNETVHWKAIRKSQTFFPLYLYPLCKNVGNVPMENGENASP